MVIKIRQIMVPKVSLLEERESGARESRDREKILTFKKRKTRVVLTARL